MSRVRNLNLVFFFVVLTVALTLVVVYSWEQFLMTPLYRYVESYYPGPENANHRWRISQRIEHFFISITVDGIVVTLLLRLVDKRQRELRESEERYRSLFEHASDGIGVVAAHDHRLVDVNRKFGDIFGYQTQALIGSHICELLGCNLGGVNSNSISGMNACGGADDSSDLQAWQGEFEIDIQTAQGKPLPISASCSALATGKEQLLILIVRDLTERKRLEGEKEAIQQQLYQSAKLASIGELSAGVAHEINNPLNGVINFAQLLKDDGAARNETELRMIDGIIDEGDRMAKIVRDLLTFARQDPHLPTRVAIAEVVENSMSLFGHKLKKDGIAVEIDIAEDLLPVVADAARLRQVVVNMISNAHNALKARPGGEKVFRITGRNFRRDDTPMVRLSFFDNGVGIPADVIKKVFDPFFTTRRNSGGTGLGLSLSFGIIRDYGGTITVEGEEGRYARFNVELPAAAEEAKYAESTARRRRAEHSMDDGGAA